MQIQLILVPYDFGRRGWRMGAGPEHLARSGLIAALTADGHAVRSVTLETSGDDVQSAFDLARQIAGHVSAAEARAAFPVILAGNCISSLGGFAGLESRTAMLWLDAHADFNTPGTSPSGFLDGMALAVITGRCMEEDSETIGGFEPLRDSNLVLLGVRSVDEGERNALSRVHIAQNQQQVASALAAVKPPELYLHIDLDALDPSVLIANSYATEGGLDMDTLGECLATAGKAKRIAAVAFTAFDPSADVMNAGVGVVVNILRMLLPLVPPQMPLVPETS
ncbi:MAG: arginase family protein [Gemmatimonadota bacterium]